MNMKKVIASVIAGAVAVSAMATSAFADTESTFNTYKVKYQAKYVVSAKAVDEDANEVFTLTLDEIRGSALDSLKVTSLTIDGTKVDDSQIELYTTIDKTAKTVKITPVILEAGKAVSFTVEAKTALTTKSAAEADVNLNKNIDINDAKLVGADTTKDTKAVVGKVAASLSTTKNYMAVSGDVAGNDITKVNVDQFDGLVATIANQIGANTGAKITFNFKDMQADSDSVDSDPSYSQGATFSSASSEDLGIILNNTSKLSKAAKIDTDAMTVTFDWDTILADSNIKNAVGEIYNMHFIVKNELAKTYDDNGTDKFKYVITGITVTVPDAAATTEAPATEAPADDTTTTPADENPKTGAAPVALALIPAALAAVVVAKKRK